MASTTVQMSARKIAEVNEVFILAGIRASLRRSGGGIVKEMSEKCPTSVARQLKDCAPKAPEERHFYSTRPKNRESSGRATRESSATRGRVARWGSRAFWMAWLETCRDLVLALIGLIVNVPAHEPTIGVESELKGYGQVKRLHGVGEAARIVSAFSRASLGRDGISRARCG